MGVTGQRMRQARKEAKVSQKEAAGRLNMTASDLCRIEKGHPKARQLRETELVAAAVMYNRSVDWLLGLSDRPYLRADLAWRLSELPQELAHRLVETPIYVLHEFLDIHGLLTPQLAAQKRREKA